MNNKISGLIAFFLPEVFLLVIWFLFRCSILDIRTAMLSQSVEIASIRLVVVSAISLALIQCIRFSLFLSREDSFIGVGKLNPAGLAVIFFVVLGIISELPSIKNIMTESYISLVVFFLVMAGLVYLLVDIFFALILRARSSAKY